MCKRLYAWHKLNTEAIGIFVQFLKLIGSIFAAQISEILMTFYLIGVLGIQHKRIQAHKRHHTYQPFNGLNRVYGVS